MSELEIKNSQKMGQKLSFLKSSKLRTWFLTTKDILRCGKNAIYNADIKFQKTGLYLGAKRSGRPQKNIPRDDYEIRMAI